ncbi:conserved hypothetical protein [Culex quinquefasciatus]|uniref:Uncharacterized protein n=1 Tax=Culex quinquefasciatus TaxID=7176 RepID=B0X7F0_CULQU|nr:conserved hypothetical protein [Culex quinquefasciatus]|eukprot:XP_001865572.1 conserved hypothetical protein [Culex quinquefasciatus]
MASPTSMLASHNNEQVTLQRLRLLRFFRSFLCCPGSRFCYQRDDANTNFCYQLCGPRGDSSYLVS